MDLHSIKLAPKDIHHYKGKNINFTVEESDRSHLKQVIEVNIPSKETYQYHEPHDMMH